MAGKQAGSSMNLILLLGLLLCGGVAAKKVPCIALIDQGDASFTGFLYASKTEKVAEIESETMLKGRTSDTYTTITGHNSQGTKSNPANLVNEDGTFNLDAARLDDIKPTTLALVRWYKEEILKMLNMSGYFCILLKTAKDF